MTLEIVQEVTKPSDLNKLREITLNVFGEKCWEARLGYAEELFLEIGARVGYNSPKLAGKEHGTWTLGSRGTAWWLNSPIQKEATSDDTISIIQEKIRAVEDTTICAFEVNYPDLALRVGFSNGYSLTLSPTASDNAFEIAYWQLYCPPDRLILEVGRGLKWSYTLNGTNLSI